jgi:HNH endonuclease
MENPQLLTGAFKTAHNVAMKEFFFHHDPCRSKTACWNWPKYKNEKGYGCITYNGIKFAVHRLSFQHYKGIIPKGMVIMHECDNPSCFNPDHLFLGTHQDNMDDMVRKGRHASAKRLESANASWAWRNAPGAKSW